MYLDVLFVSILFIYLMWVGVRRSRTQLVSIKRLLIFPIIFLFLSFHNLSQIAVIQNKLVVADNLNNIITWLIGIIIGIIIGYFRVRSKQFRVDKTQHLIEIPGDKSTLFLILGIFIVEFYLHYQMAIHTGAHNDQYLLISIVISGLVTGMMLGRSLTFYGKYHQTTESTPLSR